MNKKFFILFGLGLSGSVAAAPDGFTINGDTLISSNTGLEKYPLNNADIRPLDSFKDIIINNDNKGLLSYSGKYDLSQTNLTFNISADAPKNSDAIYLTNWNPSITVKNLTIINKSNNSDGINLSRDATTSYAKINGNLNVEMGGDFSRGIRANASKWGTEDAPESSTITVLGNTNIKTSGKYSVGVFAGQDSVKKYPGGKDINPYSTGLIYLEGNQEIDTSGEENIAIFAGMGGEVNLNIKDDKSNNTSSSIKALGKNSIGIMASDTILPPKTIAELIGYTLSGNGENHGVVTLGGDTEIITSDNSLAAIYALNGTVQQLDSKQNKFRILGNIIAERNGLVDLKMSDNSVFTGATILSSDKNDNSVINLEIDGKNSIWNMTESSNITNLTLGKGSTLNLNADNRYHNDNPYTPNSLIVNGNFNGNDSHIIFNGNLDGDKNSQMDSLIIKGNAKGTTNIIVNNLGGLGEKTLEGIRLITVEGENENGKETFKQSGRIIAGAYDYSLKLGSQNTNNVADQNNWYLTSYYNQTNVIRPEIASYGSNILAANTLFNLRLHERGGEHQYIDMLTGEQKVSTMWLRQTGGLERFRMGNGQLKTQANHYTVQMGGDITQWSTNELDRFHLGVMAGYANQNSKTHSLLTGYKSKGRTDGYNVGIYGSWYANNQDKSGLYVDSWLQYNWFNHSVDGDDSATEKYTSKGLTGSVESGYNLLLGKTTSVNGMERSYWLQPQAQAIWMGVKGKGHQEQNGTNVRGIGDNNIQLRAGLRASMSGHSMQDDGKNREFQPFIEANYLYNTKDFGAEMNGTRELIKGTRNLGEVKAGLEGQINKNLQLWGNVAHQAGNNSYSNTQAMLGIKYAF